MRDATSADAAVCSGQARPVATGRECRANKIDGRVGRERSCPAAVRCGKDLSPPLRCSRRRHDSATCRLARGACRWRLEAPRSCCKMPGHAKLTPSEPGTSSLCLRTTVRSTPGCSPGVLFSVARFGSPCAARGAFAGVRCPWLLRLLREHAWLDRRAAHEREVGRGLGHVGEARQRRVAMPHHQRSAVIVASSGRRSSAGSW